MDNLLPNIKLFEDDNIVVYACSLYPNDFLERLSKTFRKRKEHILSFFKISGTDKIRINLFDSNINLIEYSKQYIYVSEFCVGNVCNGAICYYINNQYLQDFAKARLYDS